MTAMTYPKIKSLSLLFTKLLTIKEFYCIIQSLQDHNIDFPVSFIHFRTKVVGNRYFNYLRTIKA